MTDSTAKASFASLDLAAPLQKAVDELGYETPSDIQRQTIPFLLEGRDLIGQAQTGTGKTAAFALPVLSKIDTRKKHTQCLVLAPTRELAIQVAEAFQRYAKYIPGFQVAPIYGGADYRTQLKQLERGAHVVVGTPGRVMDHMRRGSLNLDNLSQLVLDEADEMLRMGFIDDVEWVLSQLPEQRQIALFSATMPSAIRRIAKDYLNDPEQITVEQKTVTATSIRQRVWMMSGANKLEALTRILEVEDFDGLIIFTRTRLGTTELADKLQARGFAAAALNGDMAQNTREQVISQLKKGRLDIVVATDVAARGLDVERITHVVNYDIPQDAEAYVHRIGRTGRAGRSGEAILFAANRERRLLKMIERTTGQPIEPMNLPTLADVADAKAEKLREQIAIGLTRQGLETSKEFVQHLAGRLEVDPLDVAAVLLQELGYVANKPRAAAPVKEDDFARDDWRDRNDSQRDRKGPKKPKAKGKKLGAPKAKTGKPKKWSNSEGPKPRFNSEGPKPRANGEGSKPRSSSEGSKPRSSSEGPKPRKRKASTPSW